MGKNRLLTFGILAVVMTVVTSTMVAGTYAKYTTTVSASDTVTVAKWVADFKDDSGTAFASNTFNLFETFLDTGVDGELLAPGTGGTFDVYYDTTGTQTARNVKVTLNASSLSGLDYLKFYLGTDSTGPDITADVIAGTGGNLLDSDFGPTDAGAGTITVYWEWPFDNANDAADTADGTTPITNANLTVTFNATQLDTYTP